MREPHKYLRNGLVTIRTIEFHRLNIIIPNSRKTFLVVGVEALCPVCKLKVELPDDVVEGEVIEHDCGVVLEVKVLNGKVELKALEGILEDWGE